MKKLVTVREALEDDAWLGGMLGGDSFAVMRTLLLAAMGEPLTEAELVLFTEATHRTEAPTQPVEEMWIVAARRSGKTRAIATLVAYLAGCIDYRSCPRSWRARRIASAGTSTTQADTALNFVKGVFRDVPRFAALVDSITADTISLKNRIDIQIRPASFRTFAGFRLSRW